MPPARTPAIRRRQSRDHTAPLVNRPRSESAAHMPLIVFVTPLHDLISTGIKRNLPASGFRMVQVLPKEFCRIRLFR